ncbi:UvrD-helicase domain-containing protein [Corynebacterium felinum]|uniref:DNA 3'-5' helicase n=1 Tax=Corynebacterium felinum TaxID=131318 RepID=A0ABU2B8K8_9CORY|nr:UvrD-helicase domain-containing protein [Corynebacterium felinum]MDF5821082.1 UvrD-helicase domain-containing protein [Corynebacterium felinum]MDR7354947.1 DNA helicase-2/ATP-dependent DNA helicase PcrA [Corynebacterium felinum]WJY94305.1 ATP-dependent DNA helicase PcrA [Corynebacterium felinum]
MNVNFSHTHAGMTGHSSIRVDPVTLAGMLGQKFPPTEQQAEVIAAELGPMLVVAGAGAGKTETMAARVVWLAANGMIEPDRVLGLTFTRKAAQQLSARIRSRLQQLAGIPELAALDPTGTLARNLSTIAPTVSTYDAFAGKLIAEFGLLLPVEPSSRMISQTELFTIAYDVLANYGGELASSLSMDSAVSKLLDLVSELDNHMVAAQDVIEETAPFVDLFEQLPKAPRQRDHLSATMEKYRDTQLVRLQYLPLAKILKQRLSENNLMTFGEQMSLAAKLAQQHPKVGKILHSRFDCIMLDEYQDTSHAQRVLLSNLFRGQPVTAVGDPMQSIYGWRGATAANLERFVTDFVHPGQPAAPKKELTMSFRNPPAVLQLANAVAGTVLGPENDPKRPVQPLVSLPNSAPGEVEFGYYATPEAEREAVAETLAQAYRQREEGEFTAAVLVRKRGHMAPMALALQEHGVPVEIVGSEGLLDIPEVADLIAVATMLIRPTDSHAALRVLTSPMVGLGAHDLQILAKRARNLKGRTQSNDALSQPRTPMEKLEQIIATTVPEPEESIVGLADAVADLGEAEGYTLKGRAQLARLSSKLRRLRTQALNQPLPDLFAHIEQVMGIRTEVLSREDPHKDGAAGTSHLDRFHQEVAQFAHIPGTTLNQLLDYFELARVHDKGLNPGEVHVRADRVQILTAHKAKGLEWKIVCVLHADQDTYAGKVSTWITDESKVPSTLRGDAQEELDQSGAPILDTSFLENRKEFADAMKAHIEEFKKGAAEENTRLFYVAMTRSEHRLIVTASHNPSRKKPLKPYEHFELIAQLRPDAVQQWFDASEHEQGEGPQMTVPDGYFPQEISTPALETAAHSVTSACQQLPELNTDYEIFTQWEQDVTALIDEQQRLQAAHIEVELSSELTATDIVALQDNPEHFARRQRRPIPFKPNTYAKRGTAFHSWLEERFSGQSLLDEDQLPGIDEDMPEEQLEQLKESFLNSPWAFRTPTYVEHPFEVAVDGIVIRGRMDAIFDMGDGNWMIVDWKTGHPPARAKLATLKMQLAVYRHAWATLHSLPPHKIRAAFFYVSEGILIEDEELPSENTLKASINEVVSVPQPPASNQGAHQETQR